MTKLKLVIVNPDEILYEGEVDRVDVPALNQEIAILPDHTPLYAQLVAGSVRYYTNNNSERVMIEGGLIRVRNNEVSVVVGYEPKGDAIASK